MSQVIFRNFDNWDRYLDNNNNILHGCVQFMVRDGNTVAPIFDRDNVALSNPILTDEYGRTSQQVFINTDVIAYFFKYVGNGRFSKLTDVDIDTSDTDNWVLQYTSEDINEIKLHIDSDSPLYVNTIAELRDLDVEQVPFINNSKVITLLGYYNAGDKEPINYIWNEELTTVDNGGSIIKSNNVLTGRWVMTKPSVYIDSKHFGIFPSNTSNDVTDNTTALHNLFEFANTESLTPYLSTTDDYKWYKYTTLNETIEEPLKVGEGIIFLDNGVCVLNCEFDGNPYFQNHNTSISSKYVKASWGSKAFINPEIVIIDDNTLLQTTDFSNCEVNINVPLTKACTFTNCVVNCNKVVSSVCTFTNSIVNSKNMISSGSTFNNIVLTEDMFYGSPFITVDLNCVADIEDFQHKQLMWLRIKEQQGQVNYDWRNITTTERPYINEVNANRTVTNWKSSNEANLKLEESSQSPRVYTFEHCSGNIMLPCLFADNYYIFEDSELNVTISASAVSGVNFQLLNSTIVLDSDVILNNLSMDDSNIIGNGDITANAAYLYNSQVGVDITTKYTDMKDNNISSIIALEGTEMSPLNWEESGSAVSANVAVNGNIINNFISGQIILGKSENSWISTNLNIIDNVGISANPLIINRGTATVYDDKSNYTYKGNSGTLPKNAGKFTCTSALLSGYTVESDGYTITTVSFPGKIDGYPVSYEGMTGKTDETYYLTTFDCFTIGTKNVRLKMTTAPGQIAQLPPSTVAQPSKIRISTMGTVTVLDQIERTRDEWTSESQLMAPFPKSLSFNTGSNFTWKITNWTGLMTVNSMIVGTSGSFLDYIGDVLFTAERAIY